MCWFRDFDSCEKYTIVPVLSKISVFVCISLFLCLFIPPVSFAFCPDEISSDFSPSPFLYSGVWKSNKKYNETNPFVESNLKGAKHLYYWNVKGMDKDIEEARRYFMDSLEASGGQFGPALNNLGVIDWNLWGVNENIEEAKELAKKYFTKAALHLEYIPAMNNLGVIELRRENLDTLDLSKSEAVKWIRQAADENYPPALNNLGVLYLRKQKYTEAINYFERAAELNYAPALFNLGASYVRGYSGRRDYEKVLDIYEEVARIEKDSVSSFIWLGVAKKYGFTEASKVQSVVEELLTKEQVSEATSCVERISPKIHAMDPFTLYDDVAAAPEWYELPDSWKQRSWVLTYYKMKGVGK